MSVLFGIFVVSGIFLHLVSAQDGDWVYKTPMFVSRSDHQANTLGNQIIISGGCVQNDICPPALGSCYCPNITDSVEAYQPLTDTWINLAPMNRQRTRHSAVVVGTNMFIMGGRDVNDIIIQTVEVYDSLKNTWQTLTNASWVNATSDLVAVALGTTIYAVGGYTQDYDVEKIMWLFDTVALTWTLHPATLNVERGDACAVNLGNTIFVVGGFSDNFCSPLASLEVFTTANNSWTIQSVMEFPRADLACGIQHNEFHTVGGERKSSTTGCTIYDIPISNVEHYHLATDTWTEEIAINGSRFRFAAATFGTTFYIFGGQGSYFNLSGVVTYPVLNAVLSWNDTTYEIEPTPTTTADSTHLFVHIVLMAIVVLLVL